MRARKPLLPQIVIPDYAEMFERLTRLVDPSVERLNPPRYVRTADQLRGSFDVEKGIPLGQARYSFASDDYLKWLAELLTERLNLSPVSGLTLPQQYNSLQDQINLVLEHMSSSLLKRLHSDELWATGFCSNSALDGPAARIHRERWPILIPDYSDHSASAAGITIFGILVFQRSHQSGFQKRSSAVFSAARVKEWYTNWIRKNEEQYNIPSRDADFLAAKAQFGDNVSRAALRRLRNEIAPSSWKKKGRRPRHSAQSGH